MLAKLRIFLIPLFLLFPLIVLLNMHLHLISFQQYGDYRGLDVMIAYAKPFARWFLGSALILDFYWNIWRQPVVYSVAYQFNYVQTLSVLTMSASTIFLLYNFGHRLPVLLTILSPLWLMFALGYDEYYPFIAPVYLALLISLFLLKINIDDLTYTLWGVVLGTLPLIYTGFAPISFFILLYLVLLNRHKAYLAGLVALFIFGVLIYCFWPWGFEDFFLNLYSAMNFGEINTSFPRYQGESAGIYSVNFSLPYAFSIEHGLDILYILFWSGGLGSFLLLITGGVLYLKSTHDLPHLISAIPPLSILAGILLLQQIYYLTFMIPKMGPGRDIDLFFSVYFIFSFFAGLIWEKLLLGKIFLQNLLLVLYIGYSLILLYFLLIRGLPPI